jgi:UDP-2,3-diacylglucosamine hydrolase
MIIKNNALFIADAHYNSYRKELLTLLKQIKSKTVTVSQLYLMGDIFDFLCEEIEYFCTINYEVIDLINTLSLSIEIIYFEGNHDYNLKRIFPKLKIIPREQQPAYGYINEKKIALAHGDIFTPKGYELYTKVIRNSIFLHFLEIININNWLAEIVEEKLKQKKICNPMDNFFKFVENRVAFYKSDLVIEGHFHQGYQDSRYINIPSLACSNQYMLYIENEFKFITI